MPALLILLLCAATYRATRLIVADTISLPIRTWVMDRWGDESAAAYLIECPWCMSVWVGLAFTAAVVAGHDWLHIIRQGVPWPAACWGAASAFTGIVSEHLGLMSRADDLIEEETRG